MKFIKIICCAILASLLLTTSVFAIERVQIDTDGIQNIIKEPAIKDRVDDFPLIERPTLPGIEINPGGSNGDNEEDGEDSLDGVTFPSEYCMRDEYILYAQEQDRHGFCWDFAATMSASTTIMKATGEYYDFSELWTGVAAYMWDSGYNKIGAGGNMDDHYDAMKKSGLMLECDLPYVDAYTVSNENAADYYNFYEKHSNDDLASCLTYGSSTCYSKKNIAEIKNHIYNHGSLYMAIVFRTGYVLDSNGEAYYLTPNQTNTNSCHAISVIGWDDNYEQEIYLNGSDTPTVFKGAWITLNSSTEKSGTDGISFVFYNDTNILSSLEGYIYEVNTDKELYFYDKIESGYSYVTDVKGKYTGDFVAQSGETKQKNIFYDDVSLEYSYVISSGATVKSVDIYLANVPVNDRFNINIDHDAGRFYISAENADYGQYKVVVTYGNDDRTDTYLNNFFVTHGILSEGIRYDYQNNDLAFNTGRDLELYSYVSPDKNYVIYTNKLSGSVSFLALNEKQSVYSEKNTAIQTLYYEITDGKGCNVTHTITSESGYELVYNFRIEYCEDTSLSPVVVYYDRGGGVNSPENYTRELAGSETDLVLYAPTREGYTFDGWYLDYGNGSRKLETDGETYRISWDDIHHMGESPTLYSLSTYKSYYKNSNVVFVYARWKEVEYTDVNVETIGNGSVQTGDKIILDFDDSVNLKFTPENSCCLSLLEINGVALSWEDMIYISKNGMYLENVTEEMNIRATFSEGIFLHLTFGENVEDAYLTKTVNGETFKFYNGDVIPFSCFGTSSTTYFSLVVKVKDATDKVTYDLSDASTYTPLGNALFTKEVSIYSGAKIREISVGSATEKPIEKATVTYSVGSYITSHYLCNEDHSVQVELSGEFNTGDTVYLYVEKKADTDVYEYLLPSGFVHVEGLWYRKAIYVSSAKLSLGTIKATRDYIYYDVVWQNWDGSYIDSNEYTYGEVPFYSYEDDNGEISYPVRADDEMYTYTFVGWSPFVSVVTESITYTALFNAAPKKYSLTVEPTSNGTVTPEGLSELSYLDTVTCMFLPDEGYEIADVLINGVSVGGVSSYTFSKVSSNQTVSVIFRKTTHTVNIVCRDNGTADKIGQNTVEYGSDLSISITPSENFGIDFIKINGIDREITSTLTLTDITEDMLVEIAFKENLFTFTTNAIGEGSITPSFTASAGESKTVYALASEGYKVKDLIVDGVSLGAIDSYTFTDIKASHTVSVEFEPQGSDSEDSNTGYIIAIVLTSSAAIISTATLAVFIFKFRKKY